MSLPFETVQTGASAAARAVPAQSASVAPPRPQCPCKVPAKQFTVRKDGPNKGRIFFKCGHGQNGCTFFAWQSDATAAGDRTPAPAVQRTYTAPPQGGKASLPVATVQCATLFNRGEAPAGGMTPRELSALAILRADSSLKVTLLSAVEGATTHQHAMVSWDGHEDVGVHVASATASAPSSPGTCVMTEDDQSWSLRVGSDTVRIWAKDAPVHPLVTPS